MGKGDKNRAQQLLDTQGTAAQNYLTQVQSNLGRQQATQGPQLTADMTDEEVRKQVNEYIKQSGVQNIDNGQYWVDKWKEFGKSDPAYFTTRLQEGVAGNKQPNDYENLMSQYGEFAKTGGFSPQDIQDIRARAVSPIRSVYSSAQAGLDRNRELQGGYSPNYAAASAKMAREQSQGISEANVNANAGIAQMRQQGRLAGLGGAASTYGAAAGRQVQAAGIQKDLSLGRVGAQIDQSKMKGNWGSFWENAQGPLNAAYTVGKIATM